MRLMKVDQDSMDDFAAQFVADLPGTNTEKAYVVGLSGELGAGKTSFVQCVARVFGVTDLVPSPTFILLQTYDIDHNPFTRLVHVDAYRLSPEDSDTFSFASYARDPHNLILVEWPEHMPKDVISMDRHLAFSVLSERERGITDVLV